MQVVTLKQHSHLLAGSNPVRNVSPNSEGLGWDNDGFEGSEDDY